nr:hypothetical protein ORF47 [Oryza rufipogon]
MRFSNKALIPCLPLRVDKETVDDNGFRIRIERRPYRTNRGKDRKGKK